MTMISSDIYEINNFVNEIKKTYIDETDDTLSMGIFGYMGAMFSTLLQNNIIIGTEYINEMFPTKAKYEKFILEHAMTYNITDINATPSIMNVTIALAQNEIDALMTKNVFILDKNSKLFIEKFEFHLEYDIIINKSILGNAEVVYTARYSLDRNNPLSNITNPYLAPPAVIDQNGTKFILIKCQIRQIELSTVYKKIITANVIDNRTLMFNFSNQLAAFDLHIKEGNSEFYVTPLFEGCFADPLIGKYCYYSYVGSDRIKITFDPEIYEPTLNTDITIILNTTQGDNGNFVYNSNIIMALESEKYNYKNLSTMIIPTSEALYGIDRKSVEELRKLIPKEALSRGNITSNADLNNYFNSIDSDTNKLTFVKKVDNQIERTYYSYLLLKDTLDLVIPTNTINLKLKISDFPNMEDGRLPLNPGITIGYNSEYGYVIPNNIIVQKLDELNNPLYIDNVTGLETVDSSTGGIDNVPVQKTDINGDLLYINRISSLETTDSITTSDYSFIYKSPFLLVANNNPLYTSFYLNLINRKYNLNFDYINDKSEVQFISTLITLKRNLNVNNDTYKLAIQAVQNIKSDKGLVTVDEVTGEILSSKVKIIAVLSNEKGVPYRYTIGELKDYDSNNFIYNFEIELKTNDIIDNRNYIKIEDLYNITQDTKTYGYLKDNPYVNIYVLDQIDNDIEDKFRRYDLDQYVPGLEGWTVCNMYGVDGGINFFYNYSSIITAKTNVVIDGIDEYYIIKGVPLIRADYISSESKLEYFIQNLESKRNYINYALQLLEDSFGIDFKFYNTYGPSKTFVVDGVNLLDRVNLTLNFDISLLSNADKYIPDRIILDIKAYIENLNSITSIHISNLITQITNTYKDSIAYIEFTGVNSYPVANQYLEKITTTDVTIVPEFLNISSKDDFTPDINITIV
ncbi:MAG: hypothetical protein M0P49_03595 [Bacilli bacterium]|nr:hypothetical protein [Bacilli bacterium]